MKKILFFLLIASSGLIAQDNNYLELTNNLQFEINPEATATEGLYLFRKNNFALYFQLSRINTLKQKAKISYYVIRKSDSQIVYNVEEQYELDTIGQNGDLLNSTEYNAYLDQYSALTDSIKLYRDSIDNTPTGQTDLLQVLTNKLRNFRQARNDLQEVLPVYEKINKIWDVIGTHIVNGVLTASGREWIKTLPFNNTVLSEYLE